MCSVLVSSLIGVGGTLLGVVLGYCLNLIKFGMIRIICSKIKFEYFFGQDKNTGDNIAYDTCEYKGKQAKTTKIIMDLHVLNSSAKEFAFNDLTLKIKTKDRVYVTDLHDLNDVCSGQGYHYFKRLENIKFIGKDSFKYQTSSTLNEVIDHKNLSDIKFYISYMDIKGHRKCKKVKFIG